MWILKMAWKNLWRNRSRTLITSSAVGFATVISVITGSLKEGIFDNLVQNIVSTYTGHMQVHKLGYQDEQTLENIFAPDHSAEKKIESLPAVASLTPRLESFALASVPAATKGCLVIGIDPERERNITTLDKKIIRGNYLRANDSSVLIGEGLAAKLKLTVKDTLVLIGQGYHGATAAGKMVVGGIIKLGSPAFNDRAVFMSLPAVQNLFSADSLVSTWIIMLKPGSDLGQTTLQVRSLAGAEHEVLNWEELMPEIRQHIKSDSNSMRVIQIILYVLISFGIFSTLLIMMVERRAENGMLLAIGMSKKRIQFLLMAECVITSMLGCIAGILLSIPLVTYLKYHPIRLSGEVAKAYERFGFEPIFPTSTSADLFISQAMTMLVIALILSLYPVLSVMRMDPVKAMRS